jgi:hypothetical protein
VLRYLSSVWELLGPTFRIFEQFDWAPRNQNCKTYISNRIPDRSVSSINFGLFLRKAGGMSNLMQTLQNLGLSTTARNFLGPFLGSPRNFRLSGRVRTCKYWFFRRANMPNGKYVSSREVLNLNPAVKKAIILLLYHTFVEVLKDALAHLGPYQTF